VAVALRFQHDPYYDGHVRERGKVKVGGRQRGAPEEATTPFARGVSRRKKMPLNN